MDKETREIIDIFQEILAAPREHLKRPSVLHVEEVFAKQAAQTIERQAAEIERLRCDSPTSLIFRVVAEIREEFGVGYKPMLEDLPSILKQQIEVYKLGLRNARFDISKASEVVWRQSSVPETTFDYIGRIIGDELTWEEWQSRQSKGTHHE